MNVGVMVLKEKQNPKFIKLKSKGRSKWEVILKEKKNPNMNVNIKLLGFSKSLIPITKIDFLCYNYPKLRCKM